MLDYGYGNNNIDTPTGWEDCEERTVSVPRNLYELADHDAEIRSAAIDDMVDALIKAKQTLPLTDARIEEIGEELKGEEE